MKKIFYIASLSLLLASVSCVDDEGSNLMNEVNSLEIKDIEKEYSMIAYQETLEIPVSVEGTLTGDDVSNFEFTWFLCQGSAALSDHKHTIISHEKDLVYPVNLKPGTYTIYCRAKAKDNGMVYEKSTKLNVLSGFVKGFYVLGDKADGTVGLDFISVLDGRDTTYVADIFNNDRGIRGAQNVIFTGTYSPRPDLSALWIITEDGSYSLQIASELSTFNIREEETMEKYLYPTIPVKTPAKLIDIFPHPWADNTMTSRSYRMLLTEESGVYLSTVITAEAYGNPVNRVNATTQETKKIFPFIFHREATTAFLGCTMFNETDHIFVRTNTTMMASKYLGSYNIAGDNGVPFYFDQKKYNPVRRVIYGENAYGNGGRSYALLTDDNNDFYIYGFTVNTYAATGCSKDFAKKIDQDKAVGFANASHYAFYSLQSVVLYSVGNELWAYNYNTNTGKCVATFDDEITHLAFDWKSAGEMNSFFVATYSDANKGTIYKYELVDSPTELIVNDMDEKFETESYPWHTDKKVVKIEYRNCPL